ncbi:hypothetical protein E2C06_18625 [Dankookia rubra]|uniref:Uncharacterized protein n=1 Tax=Dankookia rubra TaxID=1442381 RepID=A0A4R5QEL8_9PROT|nr:hypothetical protein [Dankookia rubra]TDH61119.1 hypothetical protein E2C06_18625 [Dankookia rubra]
MQAQDSLPFLHQAVTIPGSCARERRSLLEALNALSRRAEAAGLDLTAARLRAAGKLACAELVEVRLKGLA